MTLPSSVSNLYHVEEQQLFGTLLSTLYSKLPVLLYKTIRRMRLVAAPSIRPQPLPPHHSHIDKL